ncbi:hypothetical protein J8V57_07650 [Xenorhabdus sp. PB61.4]|uniref:hypothetical protein n=1 Tax=Xenorhabdus sp. PB61.4 TaxID=2788940 RepID=UPI001E3B1E83|nr:hypothetical protein [Xenorhabdus sp. PB61.4]MCC8366157.1 hypothetical protein [Xenorhabdus sp. PB61.4]
MKQYLLITTSILLSLFLVFGVAPTLFSAKSDLSVVIAIIIILFVVPAILYFTIKKLIKWSKNK